MATKLITNWDNIEEKKKVEKFDNDFDNFVLPLASKVYSESNPIKRAKALDEVKLTIMNTESFSPEEKAHMLKRLNNTGIEQDAIRDVREMQKNYTFNKIISEDKDEEAARNYVFNTSKSISNPDDFLKNILETRKLTNRQKRYALKFASKIYNMKSAIENSKNAKELMSAKIDLDKATDVHGGSIQIKNNESVKDNVLYNLGINYRKAIDKGDVKRAETIKEAIENNIDKILSLPDVDKTYEIKDEYGAAKALQNLFDIKRKIENGKYNKKTAMKIKPQLRKMISATTKILVDELMDGNGNLPPYKALPEHLKKAIPEKVYSNIITGKITKKNESGMINPYKVGASSAIHIFKNIAESFPWIINKYEETTGYNATKLKNNITPEIVKTGLEMFAQDKLGAPKGNIIKFGTATKKDFLEYLLKNWDAVVSKSRGE